MTSTTASAGTARQITPWEYLAALLPLEDLTHAARGNRLRPAVTVPAGGGEELLGRADSYDAAARSLYRTRRGNVLLTGRKGVGKTTFVRELARRAATGEIPFLTGRRFVWIDCRNVGPEDSRACLESIFTAVATTPDVILCLDGLAALLKRTQGGGRTSRCCGRCGKAKGWTTKDTKIRKRQSQNKELRPLSRPPVPFPVLPFPVLRPRSTLGDHRRPPRLRGPRRGGPADQRTERRSLFGLPPG